MKWLKRFQDYWSTRRQLTRLERRMAALQRDKNRLMEVMAQRQLVLQQHRDQFDRDVAEAERAIRESEQMVRKMEQALEEANHRLKIAEEIEIPTLVAANETFKTLYDAQSAQNVFRQVATSGGGERDIA